jgi:hypothetical protein
MISENMMGPLFTLLGTVTVAATAFRMRRGDVQPPAARYGKLLVGLAMIVYGALQIYARGGIH